MLLYGICIESTNLFTLRKGLQDQETARPGAKAGIQRSNFVVVAGNLICIGTKDEKNAGQEDNGEFYHLLKACQGGRNMRHSLMYVQVGGETFTFCLIKFTSYLSQLQFRGKCLDKLHPPLRCFQEGSRRLPPPTYPPTPSSRRDSCSGDDSRRKHEWNIPRVRAAVSSEIVWLHYRLSTKEWYQWRNYASAAPGNKRGNVAVSLCHSRCDARLLTWQEREVYTHAGKTLKSTY